ncbi:hypothetical protein Ae717Ps2_6565 [Pseudonocardia sp. Ae717_Ps2]|nr:hypothetical protein Ae717Ps2_6512 [Pseudonocardia sp. Ae717_Ps2]OLM28363.1 hypothetical protein Ae717Ps2_6565 [Pseudonocardia sp. Ae717_Ps2]
MLSSARIVVTTAWISICQKRARTIFMRSGKQL